MCDRIDPGEIAKVIRALPTELRNLWPETSMSPFPGTEVRQEAPRESGTPP
jgi:hypothetical protein